MDIKDCKIGTRVVCVKGEVIPNGAVGIIIEDDYVPSDYLKDYLYVTEITADEFSATHKQIILL